MKYVKLALIPVLFSINLVFANELNVDELSFEEYEKVCIDSGEINNPASPCFSPVAGAKVGFDGIEITDQDNFYTISLAIGLLSLLYYLKLELDLWFYRRRKRLDRNSDE